nr:cyclic AMP-responsive element-binding protein 3-like protein 4 isoform X1 [Pogona vitticeps]
MPGSWTTAALELPGSLQAGCRTGVWGDGNPSAPDTGKIMEPSCSPLLDVLFEGQDENVSTTDPKLSCPLQDHAYGCAYETWPAGMVQDPDDGGAEDFLQLLIHPPDLYDSQGPTASPKSDSGISEDPCADTPLPHESGAPDPSPTVIYEVICDMGFVKEAETLEPAFSSPLENWPPQTMLPETCVMNELSPSLSENGAHAVEIPRDQDASEQLHLTGFYLTDEEKRLLSQEGVSLCSGLPLTKVEERILKKVRRKIRNKQSAQDSRRRKKEYIDGLESRVAACSAQNQELRKKVHELEVHHVSLLDQLQSLQKLIKQTSTKAVQTSSCLLILVVSLGLFILPSCTSLLGGSRIHQEGYQPSRVISRNILNQGGLSDPEEPSPAPGDPERPVLQTELRQEGLGSGDRKPSVLGERGLRNATAPEGPKASQTEPKEGRAAFPDEAERDRDPGKQSHADEM